MYKINDMETIITETQYTPEEEKIMEELFSKVKDLGLENYNIADKEQYEEIYNRSPIYREEFPTYSAFLEKVHVEELRNPLEGSILIHGFNSNLSEDDKNEIGIFSDTDVLRKVIKQGAIVSPSKRDLTRQELIRYKKASFDVNRVCFEARTGRETDGGGGGNYIDESFFAMPVSALEGIRISNDFAFGAKALAAYHENGVSIPLEKGILFLKASQLEELLPDIKARANVLNIDLAEYLNRYFRILPSEFKDKDVFWETITTSIEPSKDVKYHPTIFPKLQEKIREMGEIGAITTGKIAKEEELGESKLLKNTLLGSPSLKEEHNKVFRDYLSELKAFASIVKKDPEALREFPDLPDIYSFNFLADLYELTESDSNSAYKFRELLEIHEKFMNCEQERLKKIWEKRPEAVVKHLWRGKDDYGISPKYTHPDDLL